MDNPKKVDNRIAEDVRDVSTGISVHDSKVVEIQMENSLEQTSPQTHEGIEYEQP